MSGFDLDTVTPALRETQRRAREGFDGELATLVEVELRGLFGEMFASQGAVAGDPWAPLADPMATHDPLVDTGDLWRSLTEPDAPFGYAELRDGGQTLAIGSTAPGGWFAQHGTRYEPPRPIVPDPLPATSLDRICELISAYTFAALLT